MANGFRSFHCPLHTHNLIKKKGQTKGIKKRTRKEEKRKRNMTRKRGRTSGTKDPKPMRILKQASSWLELLLQSKCLEQKLTPFQKFKMFLYGGFFLAFF
ncbi:hypothetical protein OIU74_023876 [Salix koriyanagi]|uniref:Uncharacterized protein n=1 Tax=Salix koriyanagi TaxID=2511006 RepID=A0A9Q0WE76_9ROSI|nr:hypothetical protein OIU74_023876 [Salix koriyanagi]